MKKNRMNTTLMNTLKVACAGLMLLFMTPAAHAESALAWLPFGIEGGKPLTDKAKRKMDKIDFDHYQMKGKFQIILKGDAVINFFVGSKSEDSKYQYSVPKRWDRLGMRLCTKNQMGASLDAMRTMAKKEGAKYFEVDSSGDHYDIMRFEIASKYRYSLYFYVRGLSDEYPSSYCKGGMISINVGEAEGEEY